ncbi:MAG: hypothetical protein KC910_36750 [Candidatus Eremiobacteraeota bacterium]|nr:hypothetical protein [Candidatus Eremiobacteraeota bacterium]
MTSITATGTSGAPSLKGPSPRGSRLFGGFWQGLPKQDRRERITIGSEKAVELDYGQVGPRIVYGLAGLQPPPGDLYGLDFYLDQRAGIKKVMNAMLFAKARLARFPRGTRRMFRNGDRIDEVVEAIEAFHAPIRHLFHQGIGHEVQFIESQIMVQVLLTLKKAGVVALPVHDAVMVPETKASVAKEVMLSAFEAQANVPGVVTLED